MQNLSWLGQPCVCEDKQGLTPLSKLTELKMRAKTGGCGILCKFSFFLICLFVCLFTWSRTPVSGGHEVGKVHSQETDHPWACTTVEVVREFLEYEPMQPPKYLWYSRNHGAMAAGNFVRQKSVRIWPAFHPIFMMPSLVSGPSEVVRFLIWISEWGGRFESKCHLLGTVFTDQICMCWCVCAAVVYRDSDNEVQPELPLGIQRNIWAEVGPERPHCGTQGCCRDTGMWGSAPIPQLAGLTGVW